MPQWAMAVIAILAIVAIAEGIWIVLRSRRSEHLRSRFGPEYDRAVQERGNQWRAESDLERREKRVEKLHIQPLPPKERERFAEAWRAEQARFVDDPQSAVTEADRLVVEVMQARGYPVADFDQRVADISVDHPHVVENYRTAAEIARKHERGRATTEDLRTAMICYRALFDDLLELQEVRK